MKELGCFVQELKSDFLMLNLLDVFWALARFKSNILLSAECEEDVRKECEKWEDEVLAFAPTLLSSGYDARRECRQSFTPIRLPSKKPAWGVYIRSLNPLVALHEAQLYPSAEVDEIMSNTSFKPCWITPAVLVDCSKPNQPGKALNFNFVNPIKEGRFVGETIGSMTAARRAIASKEFRIEIPSNHSPFLESVDRSEVIDGIAPFVAPLQLPHLIVKFKLST
jgi:hypothetical protein